MATIQRFLLRELGTNEDPIITKTLLDLASDARTQPEILAEVRSQLAARRNGVEYMVEALGRHYDFLSGVLRAPPVGPLADALAAVGEKRAAPLLAAHLNMKLQLRTARTMFATAAHALVTLATPCEELGAVQTFFSLYHATADDDDLVAGRHRRRPGVFGQRSGAPRARHAWSRNAAADPLTNSAVRRDGIANSCPREEAERLSARHVVAPTGSTSPGRGSDTDLLFWGASALALLVFVFGSAPRSHAALSRTRDELLNDRTEGPPTSPSGIESSCRAPAPTVPRTSRRAKLAADPSDGALGLLLALLQREGRLVDFLEQGDRELPRRGNRRGGGASFTTDCQESAPSPTWTSSECATKKPEGSAVTLAPKGSTSASVHAHGQRERGARRIAACSRHSGWRVRPI